MPLLDVLQIGDGALVGDVAGVERGVGLDQHDLGFAFGNRQMLDAVRHDDEFARVDDLLAVAKFHPQSTLYDKEHLVLGVVMVPDEFAGEFHQLDGAAIDLAYQLGRPVIGEAGEFFGQIDGLHLTHPT